MFAQKNVLKPKPTLTFLAKMLVKRYPKVIKRIEYNIAEAFTHLSDDEKQTLLIQFCNHVEQSLKEIFLFPYYKYIKRVNVDVRGEQYLSKVLERGRGAMVLCAHMGNWELACPLGLPKIPWLKKRIHFVRRELGSQKVNNMVMRRYHQHGLNVIDAKGGARDIIRALSRNEVVFFALDQFATKENGIEAPLFGKSLPTYKNLARIALTYEAPVVPFFPLRVTTKNHRLEFLPEIELQKDLENSRSMIESTTRFNQVLETMVLRAPEQWFCWLLKRWELAETS